MAKEAVPYLPIDFERLDEMNAAGNMVVGVPGSMVVVRCRENDPEGKTASIEDARAYLRELVRLARLGQRIERQAAARAAEREVVEPSLQ